jgi:hypothetical protein
MPLLNISESVDMLAPVRADHSSPIQVHHLVEVALLLFVEGHPTTANECCFVVLQASNNALGTGYVNVWLTADTVHAHPIDQ